VRPIYPDECTDDFEYIRTHDCVSMTWPKHLDRDEYVHCGCYSVCAFSMLPSSRIVCSVCCLLCNVD
jgi:hypothetical protein